MNSSQLAFLYALTVAQPPRRRNITGVTGRAVTEVITVWGQLIGAQGTMRVSPRKSVADHTVVEECKDKKWICGYRNK